ncbi:MAG: hypothetical protein ACRD2C_17800 [Acidimicrobiales bacterium]
MTGRILRIELRRTAALWAAAISLPLTALAGSVGGQGMAIVVGDARTELAFLLALALGVGASQARRDRRSRTSELLATTARPQWQRLLHTAVALGIGAVAGLLGVFGGLAVYGLVVGTYVPVTVAAAVVVMALYLAAAVWLGAACGRVVSSRLVPPLIVVFGLVAIVYVALLTDPEGRTDGRYPATFLLNPSSGEGFDAFETLTGRAQLAQVAWAVALAVACLVLCVATRYARLSAVVPVVVGLAVAGLLLPRYLHEAVTVDRGAIALECTPDEPRVCVRRVHARVLDQLREPGQEALAIMSAKLPQAPTTVVETYLANDSDLQPPEPRADTLYAQLIPGVSGRVRETESDLLWTLLMGAGTLICPDTPPAAATSGRYTTARLIAAAWLLEEEPLAPSAVDDYWGWLPPTSVTGPAYEALLALPADEQRARVAALRQAELDCDDGDRLDILVGDRSAS